MKALSMDIRNRIVELRLLGESSSIIATRLMVSERSVRRIWAQYEQQGHVEPGRQGGNTPVKLREHEAQLLKWIESEPDVTLKMLAERIQEQLQIKVCAPTVWRRLKAMRISHKKNDARRRAGSPGHPSRS